MSPGDLVTHNFLNQERQTYAANSSLRSLVSITLVTLKTSVTVPVLSHGNELKYVWWVCGKNLRLNLIKVIDDEKAWKNYSQFDISPWNWDFFLDPQ